MTSQHCTLQNLLCGPPELHEIKSASSDSSVYDIRIGKARDGNESSELRQIFSPQQPSRYVTKFTRKFL